MPESNAPRSRRVFLAAAAGAAAATAVSALDPRSGVRAGVDGDVVLGALNTNRPRQRCGSRRTARTCFGFGASRRTRRSRCERRRRFGRSRRSDDRLGVLGVAPDGSGVEGSSTIGNGVLGSSEEGTGVFGTITLSGDGVHGHSFATAGVGVRASAEAGLALVVDGKATFSRSGKVTIPAGADHVDVDVEPLGRTRRHAVVLREFPDPARRGPCRGRSPERPELRQAADLPQQGRDDVDGGRMDGPRMTTGRVEFLNPEGLSRNPAFTNVAVVTCPVRTIYVGGQDAVTADGEIVWQGRHRGPDSNRSS